MQDPTEPEIACVEKENTGGRERDQLDEQWEKART
jgi:hypothetical protein